MIKSITVLFISMFLLQACASHMTFRPSTVAPAASGTVSVKQDKNKNYVVNVSLRNLAEPQNLTPAKKLYIVWVRSADNPTQKLGQVTPRTKLLKADLTATTTSAPSEVFLTAEDDAQVQQADGLLIMSTSTR